MTYNGPARRCAPGTKYHDWQIQQPEPPPSEPRTLVCHKCGKHVPAQPEDDDYEEYKR